MWPFQKKDLTLDQFIQRLETLHRSAAGISVTPDNAMRSPTVQAIVTAISRRVSVTPLHILQKTIVDGQRVKVPQPNHPVELLLNGKPNMWQTRTEYWLDQISTLVRHGKMFAFSAAGDTGPVRSLNPVHPTKISIEQNADFSLTFKATLAGGGQQDFDASQIHYTRTAARDFINGDSPVNDIKDAIGLEIAAEEFGSTFFANGAIPLLVFQLMEGFADFKTEEERAKFVQNVKDQLGGSQRHSGFMLPKGMEIADPKMMDHDKAQLIESRKYQRTVIAGAWGVPPHLVGDLERGTFNNVEQQDSDFTLNCILPYTQAAESAVERDLLTEQERKNGLIARFNLDAVLRADFKDRQEGLKIQREAGVISANEWREIEGKNPISAEDGGDEYMRPMNMTTSAENEPGNPDSTAADQGTDGP